MIGRTTVIVHLSVDEEGEAHAHRPASPCANGARETQGPGGGAQRSHTGDVGP